MRIEQVNYLSDEEYELATLLQQLGFRRTTSYVLVYLARVGEVSSRDVERGTGLRQTEVSLAMKELDAWGWVAHEQRKNPGQGWKIKWFRLKISFAKIVTEIETRKETDAKNQLRQIRKMRDTIA